MSLPATWLENAPPILLFTGKGGVGKTSLSCASAIRLADEGKRVLLVSTDPASNLDEVLDTPLAGEPRPVKGVPGLEALNIDPLEAAARYRARVVDPLRGVLPDEAIRNIEEQLSGACTVEIAAFNEFTRLIGDARTLETHDHIVLDTAPTGHILRLLALPAAWDGFIAENKTGSSCLGPLSGLAEQRETYANAVRALRDPDQARIVLVTRAEDGALREADRAGRDLRAEGIASQYLVINGLFTADPSVSDPLADRFASRGREALARMTAELAALPRDTRPFTPGGLLGADSLRRFLNGELPESPPETDPALPEHASLGDLADQMAADGPGVIMTMGKGGVGKTTLAAAIARALALKGLPVHLSTTDPAAHIAETLGEPLPNLEVDRIDPREVTRKHIENVLATAGASLDADSRALLEEELRSPCTEEVAVFNAFAETVARGRDQYVVLDTAPTGHTLLLLDASEAYHREVLRDQGELPESVKTLLPKLRDPKYTRVLLVTLPEATPVHEAERLQADLRRADIEPRAWILNQSLAGAAPVDPRLRMQAHRETAFLEEARGLSRQLVLIPWQAKEPVGAEALDKLLGAE
ncbi:MAG: arsenical pump-driving ATPase [Verrucomicrobia bacterium]|nr:arsenical pump-driving ATPase [Verrucomicrobiota bacterium]MCH8526385.1 arsenical pump-driving ATPase [Kiritimatiellia bacterium]